jgi:hypothetical protein
MKKFPFDKLQPVFIEETKNAYTRFINECRWKNPYIFTIVPLEWNPQECSITFSIGPRGNTMPNFEKKGYYKGNKDDLANYYISEEFDWNSNDVFPKTDEIIMQYCIENNDLFEAEFAAQNEDEEYDCTTSEFENFKIDLFNFLIDNMEILKNSGFFKSIYDAKILINVDFPDFDGESGVAGDFYSLEKSIEIFEKLNAEEDTKQ